MQYIVFDVWADLAQFKKPFTTMSPMTFAIPSGTAVVGMIAAILGLDKKNYWSYFPWDSYQLAIGIKKPIKKSVIPINTLKTTSPKHFRRFEEHKRTTLEFLKDCEFRIWFHWENNDLFQRLIRYLERHETHYTLSLGLAWNLANYHYLGVYDSQMVQTQMDYVTIDSILRKDLASEVDFNNRVIFSTKIPVYMRPDNSRVVDCYRDYLFDINGLPLRVKLKEYHQLSNGDRIVPL